MPYAPPPPPPPAVYAEPFAEYQATPTVTLRDEGCCRFADKTERPDSTICDAYLDTEHFRVHYATAGQHMAPGYPDLSVVQALGRYLERAYAVEVDSLGMDPPLPDGTLGGGLDLIDCYFMDLDGCVGRAHAERRSQDPDACPYAYSGYMMITTNAIGVDLERQWRLTSAHELFHLIQFAIDALENSWLEESTAERMESIVWPDDPSLTGMILWFRTPHWPLWSNYPIRKYEDHFWRFLEIVLTPDIIPEVWRHCCEESWYTALFHAIADHGGDFDDLLAEFAVWNALTWKRDDGRHFPLGSRYDPVHPHARHWELPVIAAQLPDTVLPPPTGSDYIYFYGPATANTLRITLHGDPAVSAHRRVACVATRGPYNAIWKTAPDSAGDVTVEIPDWGLYDEVILAVTSLSGSPEDDVASLRFTYSAEEIADAAADAYPGRIVRCFPNPLRETTAIHYAVPADAGRVDLDVYDLAGRLVRHLVTDEPFAGQHWQPWDGRDRLGRPVAQGTYLAVMRWRDGHSTSRLTVVR